MSPSPDQLRAAADKLRALRHHIAETVPLSPDGSLVPMLAASVQCEALDVAVRVIEEKLKAGGQ